MRMKIEFLGGVLALLNPTTALASIWPLMVSLLIEFHDRNWGPKSTKERAPLSLFKKTLVPLEVGHGLIDASYRIKP